MFSEKTEELIVLKKLNKSECSQKTQANLNYLMLICYYFNLGQALRPPVVINSSRYHEIIENEVSGNVVAILRIYYIKSTLYINL